MNTLQALDRVLKREKRTALTLWGIVLLYVVGTVLIKLFA